MRPARRGVLAGAALATLPRAAWAQTLSPGVFTHGVASGDPLSDGVIIWTRFEHTQSGALAWEIAEDEGFARITARGEAHACAANDFCVKVDARGLAAGQRYFYHFLSGTGPSPTGETQTAPQAGDAPLRVALFSCANFGFGHFHAYAHAARDPAIDLVLHAGDYIYEMARGRYPSDAEVSPGRIIEPARTAIALNEYYQRYASYHTDPGLLELRRLKPIVATWDDHEIADNVWREGAPSHPRSVPFADRVAAALKAYFDWMPVRVQHGVRIYRHLDWGRLARILVLDTRLAGRDRALSYDARWIGGFMRHDAALLADFRAQLADPARAMLGATQETWFNTALADSKARGQAWQIILQQVVMGEQIAAAGLARLAGDSASANTRRYLAAGAVVSAAGLPWNLDSWGGYPAARARVLEACAARTNNAIVLGGDSHNCWLNNLGDPSRLAAVEFAAGSVTSPGMERLLPGGAPGEREALMREANPALAWCDASRRGYGALTFTRDACAAEWRAFADVRSPATDAPTITRLVSQSSAGAGPGAWTA